MNKKIVIAALIAPCLLAVGSGCGKSKAPSDPPAANWQSSGAPKPAMGMPPGGPGGFFDRMAEQLGLTDAQKKQLEELDKGTPRPMPGRPPSQADMQTMRKSFEERQRKIESILTPEQKKKLEAMEAQGPMGGPPVGGMPPEGPPPDGAPPVAGGPPQ